MSSLKAVFARPILRQSPFGPQLSWAREFFHVEISNRTVYNNFCDFSVIKARAKRGNSLFGFSDSWGEKRNSGSAAKSYPGSWNFGKILGRVGSKP